jgi:hypothetical protein
MMATMGKGGYGTFFTYGAFCFSMFLFVWFLIPGKQLPCTNYM